MTERRVVARRLATWFAGTTVLCFAVLTAASSYLLQSTLSQELDPVGHVFEGAKELILRFEREPGTFERVLESLVEIETPPPEGYRVWNRETGELVQEFDPHGVFDNLDELPIELGTVERLDPGVVWYVGELDDDRVVGVLLGVFESNLVLGLGSREVERVALIESYHGLLVGFLVVAAIVAWVVGSRVGARVGGEIDRVRDERERTRLVIAGLAHELGAPVQNLMGEAEIMLRRDRDRSDYKAALESQLEEARSLAHTLDNLVSIAASSEELVSKHKEEIDFGELVGPGLARERAEGSKKSVPIVATMETAGRFCGDRAALHLALRNVVSNAVRFSPEGEDVHLSVTQGPTGLKITVDDRGPGVAEDERAAIFEPLRKGRAAPGERVGYGLGLALARSALERHGGRVEVGDAPGGGARFVMLLPVV